MKIIAFTKQSPNQKYSTRPSEDSFRYSEIKDRIIVAVADGITRDMINGVYPNPSPAKISADLFCQSFLEKPSFSYCNQKIKELNKRQNFQVDYLGNDFWACVGVGGVITNRVLQYEFIADCGVIVYDKNGTLRFQTANEGPNSKGSIDNDIRTKYNTGFNEDKGRVLIRSKYRNNIKEPLAYGALTGERSALKYVKKGKVKLQEGDYVIFYSDGFYSLTSSKKFNISQIFNTLENYSEENLNKIDGNEGTLVALRIQ